MPRLALRCHPATAAAAVGAVDVAVAWTEQGALRLAYHLSGDITALCIPATAGGGRQDGLWRHTCFEAFLMVGEGPGYREFNFSPAGDWAAYAFRAYREPLVWDPPVPPQVRRMAGPGLNLEAELAPVLLPGRGPWRVGLTAVVEDTAGDLSYWALQHAPGRPDFHHTDGFALQLERKP